MMIAISILMQTAQKSIGTAQFVQNALGVRAARKPARKFRVEFVGQGSFQTKFPKRRLPFVPQMIFKIFGKDIMPVSQLDLSGLCDGVDADRPAVGRHKGELGFFRGQKTPEASEISADLVLGKAQLFLRDQLPIGF